VRECGLRAPGDHGGVASSHRLEESTHLEQLVEAACNVAPQDAKARATVAQEDDAALGSAVGSGAGQHGRGVVEFAVFHQSVGKKSGGV
jgi:hypothetical protein